MNTPKWNIKFLREQNVYEPSEDTFLLLDALEKDLKNIVASKPAVILEIGSGSGVVVAAVASVVKHCHYIAVDINSKACCVTKNTRDMNEIANVSLEVETNNVAYKPETIKEHCVESIPITEPIHRFSVHWFLTNNAIITKVDIVNADLLKSFKLNGTIDVIIFNPPYVETEDEETLLAGISQSWAGGAKGRKILDELLPVLNEALPPNGIFYLVAISYNDIEDLENHMQNFGFNCSVLEKRQIQGELLYILKFIKVLK